MSYKNSLLFLVALILSAPMMAKACLNEMGTNSKGQQIHLNEYSAESWKKDLEIPWPERPSFIEIVRYNINAIKKNNSIQNMNNLGVSLVYLGNYQAAIKLFTHIEKIKPGLYQAAANLGTTYELLGDNEQALKWIKEGLRRNSNDHYGSEWLHVRILEAKIAGKPYPEIGSILHLDFGKNILPSIPKQLPLGNSGKMMSVSELASSITYQLNERVNFVRPKEQVVAGLFIDLANLEFAVGSIEKADVAYEFALRYGYSEKKIIALRRKEIVRILASTKGKVLPEGKCETCQ